MAYFKKRRAPSPNKNLEKIRRAEAAERMGSAGPMKLRFPTVERLTVHLRFVDPHGQTLQEETQTYDAQTPMKLSAPCPGQCGGAASFELDAKVAAVVEAREARSESSGKCQQRLYAGLPDECGCELKCRVEVVYAPVAEPR
jgi:hypothetical protein